MAHLFKPIQPTIRYSDTKIRYQEILPNKHLSNIIHCYWQLKATSSIINDFNYKVVSDGCIDIIFELNNTKNSFITGFSSTYSEFTLTPDFNYIGIRFLPSIFPQLFNISASELTNKFEFLNNVLPKAANYIFNTISICQSLSEIKNILDLYFLNITNSKELNRDSRFYNALNQIFKHSGNIKLADDIDTGISSRQLRRLFDFYIGDSAKSFSRIVRFQSFLNTKPSLNSLKNNKIYFDLGYFDQAHFIKDFKTFYGLTPKQALKKQL